MTLDDFFTLTEMNNGLTVPSRVKELIAIMQKQENCIVKNVNEATRQWSAVGSAIAATENQDCLDLFINLDGLRFIGEWLKNAHKFSNDSGDGFLEESITRLLQALGKLHVESEKFVATEIWTTVENLILHSSSKVQDKARVLFESWQKKRDGNKSVETDGENCGPSGDDDLEKIHSEFSLKDEKCEENKNSDKIFDPVLEDNKPLVQISSPPLPKPGMEPECHSIGAFSREDTHNGQTEFQELEPSTDIKHTSRTESSIEKFGSIKDLSALEDRLLPSTSNAADEVNSVAESSSQKNSVAVNKSLCGEGSPTDAKGTTDNNSSENQCRNLDLHVSGDNVAKKDYKFAKKEKLEEPHQASKESDVELYGTLDTLEKARQIAIQVVREVAQSCNFSEKLVESNVQQPENPGILGEARQITIEVVRENEQSCNFFEKLLESNVQRPKCPGFLELEEARQIAIEEVVREDEHGCNFSEKVLESNVERPESPNSPSMKRSQASEASSPHVESGTSTEYIDEEQTNDTQEEENNKEKGPCNFDLNQEICLEDGDSHAANQILTPVSIVSASRGVPITPLQFEGNLGWKGSAATSAFRLASPRRLPESEKDLSSSSRGCLDFDLNVSENIDERLEFDLNRTSEDGAYPPSQSHSSSSSSKQPSLKNFDLNDRPFFLNDNFNVLRGAIKSDDSAISIMGTRVEVNRKDFVPLPNGRTSDRHAYDVNSGRTGTFLGIGSVLPYAHYGYNSIAPGPAVPFSYGPGGPIPYMMDSRGAPVIVGSPSTLPTSFSQTPFFMNMTGPTPSLGPPSNGLGAFGPPLNGHGAIGPSRSSFDLNSGTMVEGGNRDPSGFLQFLSPSQARPVDEQLKPNSQPNFGSGVGGKRKEPENGWEHYPFKHYTHPWK